MKNKIIKLGLPAVLSCVFSAQAVAVNILENGDFASGRVSPWEFGAWEGSIASVALNNGRACVVVTDPGPEVWDIQFRQNNLIYVAGHTYTLKADVWSSAPITLKVDAADETGTYAYHFGDQYTVSAPLAGAPMTINQAFGNIRDTTTGKLSFLMGLGLVPAGTTVCLDNVELGDDDAVLPDRPVNFPISSVRVNQQGYLPEVAKKAVYVIAGDDAGNPQTPRNWSLQQITSAGNMQVASGSTTYFGLDLASGDTVHTIDFSQYSGAGDAFHLSVTAATGASSEVSLPFAIEEDVYGQMQYDALAYFYHNRASTPILASVVGDTHARAAGHPDNAVETYECIADPADPACRTADVSGGWYDAGDHGKYVVNGGISVWTLLNQFERSKYLGSNADQFADGTLALPPGELNNGVPDILDEARWEIEWFLKMQVPTGYPRAGMVHHKIHTNGWTAIPTLPADDLGQRVLQPVSTAATLNVAAVAAQCYRVYRPYDSAFANRCLSAARTAYSAAKSNPQIGAPSNEIDGSGGYGDNNRSDELYWAATELYLATGEATYLSDMKASGYHDAIFLGLVDSDFEVPDSSFAWPVTELLGVISMATIEDEFVRDAALKTTARNYLIERADYYVAESKAQGYGLPFDGGRAFWGSNSSLVNNMMVIALANDFTCGDDAEYLDALQAGMNYLLGNNPMDQSYVTGYGERALQNPHHRFWAKSASNLFPAPPAGVMSGGPNQGLEDPIAKVDLVGCDPLKCFLDEIGSWSTNEITINWNSPFAWVVAYMNEQSTTAGRNATAACGNSNPGDGNPDPDPEPVEPTRGGALNLLDFGFILMFMGIAIRSRRRV